MKEVHVLLSSYNGENYIKEQIDSILSQEQVKVKLLIRDDGSTDRTKEILRKYEAEHENIRVLYGENIGVIASFFALINEADTGAEYIALSDQDDVWLPEKLCRAVTLLEKENATIPLVYCSAKQLVDEALQPLPSAIRYEYVYRVYLCDECENAFLINWKDSGIYGNA